MSSKPQLIHLKDYLPPVCSVLSVELFFDIQDESTTVRNRMTLVKNPKWKGVYPRRWELQGEGPEVLSILWNGSPLEKGRYQEKDGKLLLPVPEKKTILEIKTRIYPAKNKSLLGLYESRGILCTQNEAHGFRKITYFPDRPDVMCKFRTHLSADRQKYPVLLSNGNPSKAKELPGGRHCITWEDPFPKPCYLFALVAGDLEWLEDYFVTKSRRKVTLRIYVEKGKCERARYAMESLKRAMKWDEDTFGLEYDLDLFMIAAVDDFNFGAMENKGLNIFNSQYILADQETATDQNFKAIEGVVGHEYFHNWTGNRVTCRDWFQITLKEGLTVFRDQEFSADMTSRALKRIEDVRFLKDVQFSEDGGPNAHPIQPKAYMEVNNFYTATVYQKGAEVIRMIETLIGPSNFKKGITKYFELYDGQAVTTEKFVHAMESASGVDLKQFRRWYDQPGTPQVEVKSRYVAREKVFEIKLTQKPSSKVGKKWKPLVIPVRMGLLDSQGKSLPLKIQGEKKLSVERVLVLSKESETFRFLDVKKRPVPSLLRNFSAPVQMKTDLTYQDRIFLLAQDRDPLNRYESAQSLTCEILLEAARKKKTAFSDSKSKALADAFGSLIRPPVQDAAFSAECLIPPSESYLNENLFPCRFDEVHQARLGWMTYLAKRYSQKMKSLYHNLLDKEPYRVNPQSMGKRALKNILLRYLTLADEKEGRLLAHRQYNEATNMTDQISALSIICDKKDEFSDLALKHFYEKWQKDSLVLNKWFLVQALSQKNDVLQDILVLEKDPAFDLQNPNKVRVLWGAFASNLVRFHDSSGEGYRALAERILLIDRFNPGLAARLAGAYRSYPRVDAKRKILMSQSLEEILKASGLSKDTYEIASKTLASGASQRKVEKKA